MLTQIYENTESKNEIVCLCRESWDMTEQFYALEEWLKKEGKNLKIGNYIADMGTVQGSILKMVSEVAQSFLLKQ